MEFSSLGLDEREFKPTEALLKLVAKWQENAGEEKLKAKLAVEAELDKEVKNLERRWRQADIYDDDEVKRYARRIRGEYCRWADGLGISIVLDDMSKYT